MVLRRLTLNSSSLQVLAITSIAECENMLVDLQTSLCANFEIKRACRDFTISIRLTKG